MAPTKLSCPAGATCGYTTEEVEFEAAMELLKMHRDIAHAAVDVNTVGEAVEADDGYIGEEVEFDTSLELIKGHEHTAEAVEDVNDEFMYMGLFGYTMEDARKRQHQQFQQGPEASTKLKCPASTTTTEETVKVMYMGFGYTAHPRLTCPASTSCREPVKTVRQKTGSKSAKRRQRIHDAKRRHHQRRDEVPAQHRRGEEVPDQLHNEQGGEVPDQTHYKQEGEVPDQLQYQQGEEVPNQLHYEQGGEVPDQPHYKQGREVPDQLHHKLGGEVNDQQHHLQGGEVLDQQHYLQEGEGLIQHQQEDKGLTKHQWGEEVSDPRAAAVPVQHQQHQGDHQSRGMATTEKHMTRLHEQENVMNLQQQYTKTWEQKTRSNFNLQQINLSLNLMTMEQNESLTTQPIMSRGSKTWYKKQMSEFQQNPSNPSLSRVTWEQQ